MYTDRFKKLLQQGLWEPKLYDELIHEIKKNVRRSDSSDQNIIIHCKHISYNINTMLESAC